MQFCNKHDFIGYSIIKSKTLIIMIKQLLKIGLISFILSPIFLQQISAQEEPQLIIDPQGHASMIRSVLFTPDGKSLISVSDDKTIRIWDIRKGVLNKTIRGQIGEGAEGKMYCGALSPDGKYLAVAGWLSDNKDKEYGRIRVINLSTGNLMFTMTGHTDVVNSLDFSPNGRYLASGGADNNVMIWDINPTGATLMATLKGHSESIQEVNFLDDKKIVSAAYDNLAILWDWAGNSILKKLNKHADRVSG